ncbi:hypothetical protein R3W88_023426 [Solanum pinnatisectum]|uniref:RNase H type-1 domain-containing protein n=1 Tax=Solanum pinnatisectum TaxID=50273 RepID=A0AAV9LYB7_9SOLN|nr:hypothetical protein R3W88_023426 [Solanum pinnatisectum]
MRKKQDRRTDYAFIWTMWVPFKVNFFLWRVWKMKIPTDDNLEKMKIQVVSRSWCCDEKKEETTSHIFLTASLANKLWRQFANFAGLRMKGMHLQQLIIEWWKFNTSPQLQRVMRAMPAIIIKLVKTLYPWIHLESNLWPDIAMTLKWYTPKLHYHSVLWKPPDTHRLKCNTNGASKGNPGLSSYGFCLRNSHENLIYARAAGVGTTTNTKAEAVAIHEALEYCWENRLRKVIIETDSLYLMKMIRGLWKIPWDLVERGEIIRKSSIFSEKAIMLQTY